MNRTRKVSWALPLIALLPGILLLPIQVFGIPRDITERMEELREQIAHHDKLYFRDADPIISDHAYDQLVIELSDLQAEAGRADADSPMVGDDRIVGIKKSPHGASMLSLEKCYSEGELTKWLENILSQSRTGQVSIRVEPKLDGMAISLVYQDGRFVRAVTRGNGIEGDDVSRKMLTVGGFPKELSMKDDSDPGHTIPSALELRGEVFIPLSRFKMINKDIVASGKESFKTPRNLAAGSVRLEDNELLNARGLQLAIFDWGLWNSKDSQPASQEDFLNRLNQWGMPAIEPIDLVPVQSTGQLVEKLGRYKEVLAQLDMPTDGLVIKVESISFRDLLGTGNRSPNWAVAYKFKPESGVSQIRSVQFQLGRTGVLTPVATLDPLVLGGRTISRVTLHNRSVMQELDIRLLDKVEIESRGDAIPSIVGVFKELRGPDSVSFEFPDSCPECDSLLESVGRLRCLNSECPQKRIKNLMHFATSVGMKGIGQSTITTLYGAGLLGDVADFYSLRDFRESGIEQIGEKNFAGLLEAINSSMDAPAWKIVYGLGIPGMGPVACRVLMRSLGNLKAFIELAHDEEELLGIGLNQPQVRSLKQFHRNLAETGLLLRLLDGMHRIRGSAINSTGLEGGQHRTSR